MATYTNIPPSKVSKKSLKAELVWRHSRQSRREFEVALFEYINGFNNPHRKHSALGWKHPWPSNRVPAKMTTRSEQNRCRSKRDQPRNNTLMVELA